MDVSGTDGFYIGDRIVINKDVARKTGAISVGSHEVLPVSYTHLTLPTTPYV